MRFRLAISLLIVVGLLCTEVSGQITIDSLRHSLMTEDPHDSIWLLNAERQVSTYLIRSQIYEEQGDLQRSLDNYRMYSGLRDSIFNIHKEKQFDQMQDKYKVGKREVENTFLKLNIESQNKIIYAVIIAFVLLIFMMYFIKLNIEYKQKSNILLRLLNQQITKQKNDIARKVGKLRNINERINSVNQNLEQQIEVRAEKIAFQHKKIIEYSVSYLVKLRKPLVEFLGLVKKLNNGKLHTDKSELLQNLQISATHLDGIIRETTILLEDEE